MATANDVINFGTGLNQLLGIKVAYHAGSPCTDGETVWLDNRPAEGLIGFQIQCGIAVHESAHVYFRSPQKLLGAPDKNSPIAEQTLGTINGGDSAWNWFAKECLNVALDIHDETRIEKAFPTLRDFLHASNQEVAGTLDYSKLPPWRAALVLGILKARVRKYSWLNRKCRYFLRNHPDPQGVIAIWRTCNSCREKTIPSIHKRTTKDWKLIIRHAKKLYDLIRPDVKQEDNPLPDPNENPDPDDSQTSPPDADPMWKARKDIAESLPKVTDPDSAPSPSTPGLAYTRFGTVTPDRQTYDQAKASLPHAVDILMEARNADAWDGWSSRGTKLDTKRWKNAYTDGRVFSRRGAAAGEELNLALILDRSVSMEDVLPYTLSLCQAFGEVFREAGAQVTTWLFGCHDNHTQWDSGPVRIEGSTYLNSCLTEAGEWLLRQSSGRKLALIFTDGELSDPACSQSTMINLIRHGVESIIIGYNKLETYWVPQGVRCMTCGTSAQGIGRMIAALVGPPK